MKSNHMILGLLAALTIPAHAERKPNVLLIVADDLGWGELTSQGFTKEIPTPNIDSISANGVRFTNGYVSGPYCSPTRAGLLTGRYQQRFGHEFNFGPPADNGATVGLSLQETTFGDRLKAAGYTTGWFGKSHLGNTPEYHPLKRGFDEFYGFLGGAHGYFEPGQGVNAVLRGTEPVKESGYLTETFAKEAASFIERKKDQQWFVYLPFNAVHSPLDTLKKHEDRFASISDPKRRKFAALLTALDESVGTVLDKVRELKLEEDTIIYFISDNGGPTSSTTSGNGPLKGYKAQTSEGGIRVPFAIQWKGSIPAGKVDERPVIQLDLLPTSLAAAGVEIDPAWKLDGVNLLPYLKEGGKTEPPHETLFWRFGQQIAIRRDEWKLVKSAEDGVPYGGGKANTDGAKLYNLATDIGEKNDLASQHPDKVKELTEAWNAWNSTLVDPKWIPDGNRLAERRRRQAGDASRKGPWKSGDALPAEKSPDIAGKGFTISAEIDVSTKDGVIIAQGGNARGYALHIAGGRLVLSVRNNGELSSVESTAAIAAGNRKVEATVSADRQVKLTVDGQPAGEGKLASLITRAPGQGLTVGNDGGAPVGEYAAPHAYAGKVTNVTVTAH